MVASTDAHVIQIVKGCCWPPPPWFIPTIAFAAAPALAAGTKWVLVEVA